MSTPDEADYTSPSKKKTGSLKKPKKEEWGPDFEGGSKEEYNRSIIRIANQYEGRMARSNDQRRKQSAKKEEESRGIQDAIGFRPYADWFYEEVFTENPRNAEFFMGEGKRDNSKSMFTQWVMRRTMETLFGIAKNLAIVITQMGPDQPNEWNHANANAIKKPDAECLRHCLPDPITEEYTNPTE